MLFLDTNTNLLQDTNFRRCFTQLSCEVNISFQSGLHYGSFKRCVVSIESSNCVHWRVNKVLPMKRQIHPFCCSLDSEKHYVGNIVLKDTPHPRPFDQ